MANGGAAWNAVVLPVGFGWTGSGWGGFRRPVGGRRRAGVEGVCPAPVWAAGESPEGVMPPAHDGVDAEQVVLAGLSGHFAGTAAMAALAICAVRAAHGIVAGGFSGLGERRWRCIGGVVWFGGARGLGELVVLGRVAPSDGAGGGTRGQSPADGSAARGSVATALWLERVFHGLSPFSLSKKKKKKKNSTT